jgi:hypothetical protein
MRLICRSEPQANLLPAAATSCVPRFMAAGVCRGLRLVAEVPPCEAGSRDSRCCVEALSLAGAVGAWALVAAATGACVPTHGSILLAFRSDARRVPLLAAGNLRRSGSIAHDRKPSRRDAEGAGENVIGDDPLEEVRTATSSTLFAAPTMASKMTAAAKSGRGAMSAIGNPTARGQAPRERRTLSLYASSLRTPRAGRRPDRRSQIVHLARSSAKDTEDRENDPELQAAATNARA